MPTVKPSEKTGHEGEWWRKDKTGHPAQSEVSPQTSTDTDATEIFNEQHEEMEPNAHPSSG